MKNFCKSTTESKDGMINDGRSWVKGQKRRPPNLQLKTYLVWHLIFSRNTEKLHRPTYYDLSTDV